MRARYTAYTRVAMDYVLESTHPESRAGYDPENARRWAEQAEWHDLQILTTEDGGPDDRQGTVEFIAAYTLDGGLEHYHEIAEFERLDDRWYFREGRPGTRKPETRDTPKMGRNDPCPCGSGRKYKRCCGG